MPEAHTPRVLSSDGHTHSAGIAFPETVRVAHRLHAAGVFVNPAAGTEQTR